MDSFLVLISAQEVISRFKGILAVFPSTPVGVAMLPSVIATAMGRPRQSALASAALIPAPAPFKILLQQILVTRYFPMAATRQPHRVNNETCPLRNCQKLGLHSECSPLFLMAYFKADLASIILAGNLAHRRLSSRDRRISAVVDLPKELQRLEPLRCRHADAAS